MTEFTHDKVVPFKDSKLGKKQQVAAMFDRIAFRYDFLNRFLSGGIDIYWRRRAIRELSALHPKYILDVATGTADMAIFMTRHLSPEKITGIDISTGMLEIGRQKIARNKLEGKILLQEGDSENIQAPDNTFDAITVAFGVRNFENLEKGLKEMLRVLRPGGRLVILEFSHPKTPGIRQLYNLYLNIVAPRIGGIMTHSGEAYQYLNDSVKAFPEGPALVRILENNGYVNTRLKRLSLGICSIYTGEKTF
ncbi:MAG: bifunctional demethylmenaquinone methyltransferase/2-methoxy-6-polyprenyl-1,4-benzoquinol methylase UbiE [Chitinophagaceae bacterium]|nr:bifunctional demethylmenaquinone methyltransferase/2-methoxy-6-polyprenyl-1,4-benzoquinol methylase UbiE [Chitinophagaceae bacterium]